MTSQPPAARQPIICTSSCAFYLRRKYHELRMCELVTFRGHGLGHGSTFRRHNGCISKWIYLDTFACNQYSAKCDAFDLGLFSFSRLYRVRATVLAVQKGKKISSSRREVESSAEASVDVEQEVNHATARQVLLILFYLYSDWMKLNWSAYECVFVGWTRKSWTRECGGNKASCKANAKQGQNEGFRLPQPNASMRT